MNLFAATLDLRPGWQLNVCFRHLPVRRNVRRTAVKLFSLRRASQSRGGRIAAGNDLGDFIEVAGADETLVRDGAVAEFLRGKFFLLQFRIGGHAGLRVAAREVEHGHIECAESAQRDELEFVAHLAETLLDVRGGY